MMKPFMSHSPLHVVILAAGKGSRMRSSQPKVLHTLAGKPLLKWVIEAAAQLSPEKIHVITGHGHQLVESAFADYQLHFIYQEAQLGTADALRCALPYLEDDSRTLILAGDVPLIQASTLTQLCQASSTALHLLVAKLADPTGYGRIIRNDEKKVQTIVEEKDASQDQRTIQEIYTGICLADTKKLKSWLPRIQPHNAQKEYYLTDIISLAAAEKACIATTQIEDPTEISGVNSLKQLVDLERYYQRSQAEKLLSQGVKIIDPSRIDIRGTLRADEDVCIDINTVFEGEISLHQNVTIGANCVLKNVIVEANTQILSHSVIEGAHIGPNCTVGPFARIRPGTNLKAGAKVGNFVETKNIQLGEGSKANHLAYLGDATIGSRVNIGAGTIICNYDGAHKHATHIADEAFIGSGSQLIAPIHIGKKATVGAGTTLRNDAPADALTLSVKEEKTILNWTRPSKTNKE